ncbi:MAG TPA: Rid family detoxifying hydrolase [Puia sp.]|jgi:2-iminobutanoate/2-iminopropanoate deaminase|nr:Rid family detoxifying hydrolase [Puia sp.]
MKKAVRSPHAPLPMGPFSQAIVAGGFVFVSALLAEDVTTGKLVQDDIEAETRQVMDNLQAILREAGVDFSHAVKCSIFLKDMNDYARVNKVYSSYFREPFPARETIQVADLPKHVNVEISVIAAQG